VRAGAPFITIGPGPYWRPEKALPAERIHQVAGRWKWAEPEVEAATAE
jgi:hypothetical protein